MSPTRGEVLIQGTVGAYHAVGFVEVLGANGWSDAFRRAFSDLPQDLYQPGGHASWYEALGEVLQPLLGEGLGAEALLPNEGDPGLSTFTLTSQVEVNPVQWEERKFERAVIYTPKVPRSAWSVRSMRDHVLKARKEGWTTPCRPGTWLHKVVSASHPDWRVPGVDYPAWVVDQLKLSTQGLSPAFQQLLRNRACSEGAAGVM